MKSYYYFFFFPFCFSFIQALKIEKEKILTRNVHFDKVFKHKRQKLKMGWNDVIYFMQKQFSSTYLTISIIHNSVIPGCHKMFQSDKNKECKIRKWDAKSHSTL